MPIEVRELIVKVNVGATAPAPAAADAADLAAIKRDLVKACLAEMRQLLREREER